MKRFNRSFRLILLALCGVLFASGLLAQEYNTRSLFDYDFSGARSSSPQEEPAISEEDVVPPETPQEESFGAPPGFSAPSPFPQEKRYRKKIVEVPASVPRQTLEAGDIRDPFFLIRGYREEAKEALEPGVTIDGIRFNSYPDSKESEIRFFQDSNFALEDVFGRIRTDNRDEGCQFCHHGIEEISPNHRLECTDCHGGNSGTRNEKRAHKSMVANPSSPQNAARYCGKCHMEQVTWMEQSLMATARGITGLTRHAWGRGETAKADEQSAGAGEKPAGDAAQASEGKEAKAEETAQHPAVGHGPVQEFLDKKCLRCHLSSEAPRRSGDYRATGCAACHMVYTNDGTTLTRDRAVQRSIKGGEPMRDRFLRQSSLESIEQVRAYPVVHQFTVATPSVQCEHCHQNNGVGDEYEGLFAPPARPAGPRKQINGEDPVLHGRHYEFLVPDIHRERGMHCIDCHSAVEMKQDASKFETLHDAVTIQCVDCHGTHEAGPAGKNLAPSNTRDKALADAADLNPNLARKVRGDETILMTRAGTPMVHVRHKKDHWELVSKVTGRRHRVPLLKDMKEPPIAHRVGGHLEKVECHACHARWSASEWGLHAIREPDVDAGPWKDWEFSDPAWNNLVSAKADGEETEKNGALLWPTVAGKRGGLEGEWSPGQWITLFARGDWSRLLLGKNTRGKVSVLKPRHQVFITDNTVREGADRPAARVAETPAGMPGLVLTPHAPHTIRPTARTCESCHENREAVGLGAAYLASVKDGKAFLKTWKETGILPDNFQLGQVLAEDGTPIQTVLPEGARTLTLEEAQRLLNPSEQYKISRWLDLQEKNLDTLLSRKSFPYDHLHELNRRKYGEPTRAEDLYYNKNTHRFESHLPQMETAGEDGAGSIRVQDSPPVAETPMPEGTIEFSRERFPVPKTGKN